MVTVVPLLSSVDDPLIFTLWTAVPAVSRAADAWPETVLRLCPKP